MLIYLQLHKVYYDISKFDDINIGLNVVKMRLLALICVSILKTYHQLFSNNAPGTHYIPH